MKLHYDCVPCFLRQAIQATQFSTQDDQIIKTVISKTLTLLQDLDWDLKPIDFAHEVHGIIKEVLQIQDPYYKVKKESNQMVLEKYEYFRSLVKNSDMPLKTILKLAIAGNVIDFGSQHSFDFDETVQGILHKDFAISNLEKFAMDLEKAKTVVYLTDNAGEIVLDKLFIEWIQEQYTDKSFKVVVKAEPIINDAMREDAEMVGLTSMKDIELLEIGTDKKRHHFHRESPEFISLLSTSDMVISKGQANYEALSEVPGIYFLTMVKCPVIARNITERAGEKVSPGEMVLWKSR